MFKKFCWRVDRLSTEMKYTKTEIWGLFVNWLCKQKSPPRRDFYRLSNWNLCVNCMLSFSSGTEVLLEKFKESINIFYPSTPMAETLCS